jgi:hypothetical protein
MNNSIKSHVNRVFVKIAGFIKMFESSAVVKVDLTVSLFPRNSFSIKKLEKDVAN